MEKSLFTYLFDIKKTTKIAPFEAYEATVKYYQ